MKHTLDSELVKLLEDARGREKAQTLFYRALAAEAELGGDVGDAERLNELHADEQHHLSRLTARVLELGAHPVDLPGGLQDAELEGWEDRARERESSEIAFYQALREAVAHDSHTLAIVDEILESELQHHRHLGGKWMPA